ncbi:MAG: amidase [Trueperaceae bacterium]|nr:MAG: amidase [Trueperaceae bacterium]
MNADELAFLPLSEQAGRIGRGELSPVELTECYLERIARCDDSLKAFITVLADDALAAASEAEAEILAGGRRSPLHGIPFAVKDQILIEGVRVTGGSRILADHVADRDATVVARLKEAGAVLLGTLNTHEFHMGPTRDFPFGTPRNPWNLERTPGGSSSGSAAAVAAGLCSFSLGGDTSGSIRGPAAYCGVVGLKATWSRVSRDGVFPLAWSFDCVGPLARSALDAALVLQALAGRDPMDPTSSGESVPDYAAALTDDLDGVRVGVVEEMMTEPYTGTEARDAVEAALEVLRSLGATVRPVRLPLMDDSKYAISPLVLLEASGHHRPKLLESYHEYDYNTRIRLMVGAALPSGVAAQAERARVAVTRQVLEALEEVDVLVGAAASGGAPALARGEPITSKEEATFVLFGTGAVAGHHSRVFSLAGVPALSVPCGFDADGLPLGLHVAGRYFDETAVLRVAHAYGKANTWSRNRPPLAVR